MAKELPYFRFTIQEWQNGDISTMPDSCKGVFIDICPFYWAHNCEVTEDTLFKKFKTKGKLIQKLIKSGVIKCQNGVVSISFLDQQLSELNQKKSFFSDMGKLGQKVKKTKAPLKTDLSYKDKDKDKDNIPKNKHSFSSSPYYDFEVFKEILSKNGWNIEKIKNYYDRAEGYSEANGGKYLDWIKAVQNWERKSDKPKQASFMQ